MFLTSIVTVCSLSIPTPLFSTRASTPSSPRLSRSETGTEVPGLAVGDRRVNGRGLKPYEAGWTATGLPDGARITEVGELERIGGRRCYVRRQIYPMQGEVALHSTVVVDAKTLETVSLEQEIRGLPPGASIGALPVFTRWEFDGAAFVRTTRTVDGEPETHSGTQEEPTFAGSALGLIVAALPLEDGFEAQLPVSMSLNGSPDLTHYRVRVRVVGKEPVARPKGKDVEAWVVEVDWLDWGTQEVTSAGGADQPGGAYFVIPRPPKGMPHVPLYANASMRIEWDPDLP